MTRRSTNVIGVAGLCLALCVSLGRAQEQTSASPTSSQEKLLRITKEVRKQIVTLPQYGVFDNIHFGINPDGTVVLRGEASRPTLKSSAEKVVKKIEGVEKVDNRIEVLPASFNDDRIRRREARAIFGYEPLSRYSMGVLPSIRIIVKNGNVSLQGVVNSAMDKNLAGIRANGVPGVFSVENNLMVER